MKCLRTWGGLVGYVSPEFNLKTVGTSQIQPHGIYKVTSFSKSITSDMYGPATLSNVTKSTGIFLAESIDIKSAIEDIQKDFQYIRDLKRNR